MELCVKGLSLCRIVPAAAFGKRKQPTIAECFGHVAARDTIRAF
jgi:hypothetical protein